MAYRVLPHPYPPFQKGDGTLNALGQLKLYRTGTSTPKVAYKDVAGAVSYGSTIDLDSAGLPEDGEIYWDTTALYKVEVYTRTDNVPTYALDYTVNSFGSDQFDGVDTISSTTAWTVDGVGATATTFTSLGAAMDGARGYIITGDGLLNITVQAGTYTDDTVDLSHPQGAFINIAGANMATTILHNTTVSAPILSFAYPGTVINSITDLTLKQDVPAYENILIDNAIINQLDTVTCTSDHATGLTASNISIENRGTLIGATIVCKNSLLAGVAASAGSYGLIAGLDTSVPDITAASTHGVWATGVGTSLIINSTTSLVAITGQKYTSAAFANESAVLKLGNPLTINHSTVGMLANKGAIIRNGDGSPTITTITDDFQTGGATTLVNTLYATVDQHIGSLIQQNA